MKKSINAWSFPNDWDFEKVFSFAKELGFECIELNLDNEGAHSFTFDSDEKTFAHVRELIKKYGIEVQSVSTGKYWSSGAFGSDDVNKKNEAIKVMRKQIECARGIGADTILVVTCIDNQTGYKKSFENTINTFRELEDEIKAMGINIGLENVWNRFFMSPFDVKYVLDAIDNPLVGLYLDIGNMLAFSLPEYWIEVAGKYIKKVHIKDFKKHDTFNMGGVFCDLLEGDLDCEKVIPMLKAAGYDGPLSAELFNENDAISPETFITTIYNAIEKIVKMA